MTPAERFLERRACGVVSAAGILAAVTVGHLVLTGRLPGLDLLGCIRGTLAFAGLVDHRRRHRTYD